MWLPWYHLPLPAHHRAGILRGKICACASSFLQPANGGYRRVLLSPGSPGHFFSRLPVLFRDLRAAGFSASARSLSALTVVTRPIITFAICDCLYPALLLQSQKKTPLILQLLSVGKDEERQKTSQSARTSWYHLRSPLPYESDLCGRSKQRTCCPFTEATGEFYSWLRATFFSQLRGLFHSQRTYKLSPAAYSLYVARTVTRPRDAVCDSVVLFRASYTIP